jgi:hypothetical protein
MFMWLVAHERCDLRPPGTTWSTSSGKCPLCDQEDETIDHLLVSCVFARQFWYLFLKQVEVHSLAPQPMDLVFDEWWERAHKATSGLTRKGLNSLIILGAWVIWKHRNRCVFDGASPNMVEALILLGEECRLWMMVGARGLSHLMAVLPGV